MQELKTTITLDEDIASAIETEMRLRPDAKREEIITELIKIGIKANQKSKSVSQFKVRARSMGIRPELNYDKVGILLDEVEGITHK